MGSSLRANFSTYWELIAIYAIVGLISTYYAFIWWWALNIAVDDASAATNFVLGWQTLVSTLGIATMFYVGRMLSVATDSIGSSARSLNSVHGSVLTFMHRLSHHKGAGNSAEVMHKAAAYSRGIVVGTFAMLSRSQSLPYADHASMFWSFAGGSVENDPAAQLVHVSRRTSGAPTDTRVPWTHGRKRRGTHMRTLRAVSADIWKATGDADEAEAASGLDLVQRSVDLLDEMLSSKFGMAQPEIYRMLMLKLQSVEALLSGVRIGRAMPPSLLRSAVDVGILMYVLILPVMLIFMNAWMMAAYPVVVLVFGYAYIAGRWIKSRQNTPHPYYPTRAWTAEVLADIDAIADEHAARGGGTPGATQVTAIRMEPRTQYTGSSLTRRQVAPSVASGGGGGGGSVQNDADANSVSDVMTLNDSPYNNAMTVAENV